MQYRNLFTNRNFVFYSIGQVISQFGDRLAQMVLVGFIYKISPGSTVKLAKLISFTVIPAFFVSPVAGVWVDRWNNKKTMIICDVIRGCLVLTLSIFVIRGGMLPIYGVIFLIFTCACFFLPAKFAIVPDIVPQDKLLAANSVSTIATIIGGVAGLTIGGVIVEIMDINNAIYLNTIIYFMSAASLSFIIYRPLKEVKRENLAVLGRELKDAFKSSFLHELGEGLRYLFRAGKMRFVIYVLFILMSMVGAIYVVSAVFIQEVLGSMTKDIGLLGLFLCGGLLAGASYYGRKGQGFSRERAIYLSLMYSGLLVSFFAAALYISHSFWLGAATAFFMGASSAPLLISANTIIHEEISGEMMGRIFSSLGVIMNAGLLLFMFLASVGAEFAGRMWILFVSGLVFAGFGLKGLLLKRGRKD